MKKCCRCGLLKSKYRFSKNKRSADGRRYACKLCDRIQHKEQRRLHPGVDAVYNAFTNNRKRQWLNEQKNKPCTDCHTIYPPCVMDFDHLDPQTKQKQVGLLSLQQAIKEIKKCELVCANCHRLRTARRLEEKKNGLNYYGRLHRNNDTNSISVCSAANR